MSLGSAPRLLFAFAAHGLIAVIGFVTVPIYLGLMGAEAYGLVGFYLAAQAWMLLLDAGLAPMLARQLAMYSVGALRSDEAAGLIRAAEILYLSAAAAFTLIFWFSAEWIAIRWLTAPDISHATLIESIRLLALLMATRWMAVLYHSTLTGLEKQTALNTIFLVGTASRAAAAIAVLSFLSSSPVAFFAVQLVLTLAEVVACWGVTAAILPIARLGLPPAWSRLRRELRFAGALAITTAFGVAISQSDKLALSHFMPLREFGLFSLITAVAGGLVMLTPPLTQLISPRLTALHASERRGDFIQLYRLAGSLMAVVAISVAGTIAAHPDLVFRAWTGDRQSAELSKVLSLYAIGAGCAMWLMIPFQLQYACGRLRLHLVGTVVLGVLWIPSAIFAAKVYGPLGTGVVWLLGNAAYVLGWTPVVHRRLLTSQERANVEVNWFLRALMLGALVAATAVLPTAEASRWEAFLILAATALIAAGAGLLLFPDLRAYARETIRTMCVRVGEAR